MTSYSTELHKPQMPSAKSSRSLGALLTSAGGARVTSYAIGLIGWIILAEIKDYPSDQTDGVRCHTCTAC